MSETAKNTYAEMLAGIKSRVQTARVRAGLAANRELVLLYWDIGRLVAERQDAEGWGASIIDRLSSDIRRDFPGLQGFSARNIIRMKSFYLAYGNGLEISPPPVAKLETGIWPQAVAKLDEAADCPSVLQLPWAHNVLLIEKIKDPDKRLWYMRKAIEHGWSRNVLALHIDQQDYERKGLAVTNFSATLPSPQSDLAQELLKDPYIFDFLGIAADAREKEVETALLVHLRDFLLELGGGFAFVGNQVRLDIDDEDYYIDLLFYHLKLRCYFVIDLKTRPFAAEDAGKMNFYLNAVDDLLRHPDDQPSIGLVLCRAKEGSNKMLLEYALRGLQKPVGVSAYQLTRALPDNLKPSLPTVEEIEIEIAEKVEEDKDAETGMIIREWVEKYRTRTG
ncbi:MAG TPA: PDDEXK nuclease domain-containing protein [Pontiellaceae bacterium]|mgnify:CR=1 FL=1|nr:PDDEXK nuclease domain-containing protein [Pontiellaceae bacterium]